MDLDYLDNIKNTDNQLDFLKKRRSIINSYLKDEKYPKRFKPKGKEIILGSKPKYKNSYDFNSILNSFYSWSVIFVYIQGVQGFKKGLYFYNIDNNSLILVDNKVNDLQISKSIQNQNWISGGGFCLLIGSDWERYSWIYRHSRAYINLLIQIGEISEEFLIEAYGRNISGWMTPAVSETLSNKMCKVYNKNIDMLYFMKFGISKKNGKN